MAVTATPVFVQNPKITPVLIQNADASNKKVVATAGANGMKVTGIIATSDDSSSRIVQLFLTRSAVDYLLGARIVTALAGSDGAVATINLLDPTYLPGLPVDNDGQPYLFLESGDALSVATTTTVTSAKKVTVTTIAGNL